MQNPQKRATLVSSTVATVLVLFKLITGILSGSVAILASAIDSLLDLCVSLFNYFALHTAGLPPSETFNYGKGKIEALACVVEGSMIIISAFFILYQSVKKIYLGEELEYVGESIVVMAICLLITFALVCYLRAVAKKTNNLVIKADSLHYQTDLLSNGAVLLALAIVHFSGWSMIDGIFGVAIACYIAYSAIGLLKEGVCMLFDRAMDAEMVAAIQKILSENQEIISFHGFKTRQSGNYHFCEIHLVFPSNISLLQAHDITHKIEDEIQNLRPDVRWEIMTHLDPYDDASEDAMRKQKAPHSHTLCHLSTSKDDKHA
ncbi:MAG: cation diffusion facilitator family transporter [Helicobacter sp.]|nr:cation diffusion facilitator family transporter [Helicobacter sp.]